MIGGGACVAIGAIINLSSASSTTVSEINQESDSKGSPIPIIIGLAGMGVGAVMKISGHSQMKKAVENYRSAGIIKRHHHILRWQILKALDYRSNFN